MRFTSVLMLMLCAVVAHAQTRIDSDFAFQGDPAKKYSLYIPSSYAQGTPNHLMVGFHPFNVNRWDAEAWCDTLIVFAETNNLILVCPDGGTDGQVDDPIDTAFTTALIDSVRQWYSIDDDKIYAMGFSVGGRATYTYGLNHIDRFGGFIPIGAAVNGTSEVNGVIENSSGKPYYLVHGSTDAPAVRFDPVKTALENNGAIVNSILMQGVGHTIDFPNRNQILSDAYVWIDSVNCASLGNTGLAEIQFAGGFEFSGPTQLIIGAPISGSLTLDHSAQLTLKLYDLQGRLVTQRVQQAPAGMHTIRMANPIQDAGLYLLSISTPNQQEVIRFRFQ